MHVPFQNIIVLHVRADLVLYELSGHTVVVTCEPCSHLHVNEFATCIGSNADCAHPREVAPNGHGLDHDATMLRGAGGGRVLSWFRKFKDVKILMFTHIEKSC